MPVALAALLLLGLLVMPQILTGDGSPEGELRLFLLYAGQCAFFSLSLLGVGYAVWSEAQERRLGVDQVIATRPVSITTVVFARVCAILVLLLSLAVVDIGLLSYVAWQGVHGRYEETLSGAELKERMAKVHHFENLYYLGKDGDLRPKGGKTKKKVKLKPGEYHVWDLPLEHKEENLEVSGKLLGVNSELNVFLDIRVYAEGKALWRNSLNLNTGSPFRLSLPPALQNFKDLQLMISQMNQQKEPLIYTSHHPFQVRVPGGSLEANIGRAFLKMSLLWLYLLTLAFVIARLLPPQTSLLPIGFICLVGTTKSSIEGMLFPISRIPEELQPDLTLGDVFYTIVWRPLLGFVPDFQHLNPIPYLARGERVPLEHLPNQLLGIGLLLILSAIVTHIMLPRRERLPLR